MLLRPIAPLFATMLWVLCSLASNPTWAMSHVPKGQSQLRVAIGEDILSLDPATAGDTQTLEVISLIHATLFETNFLGDTAHTQPLLAHDWPEVSADKMTVKIRIRPGIKFHKTGPFADRPQRDLQARDFVYAFTRLALPVLDSDGYSIFARMLVGMRELRTKLAKLSQDQIQPELLKGFEGIQAIDDLTLVFHLTQPVAHFEDYLTLISSAPVPPETGAREITEPTGVGPYEFERWNRGKFVSLRRNPNAFADFYPTKATETQKSQGLLVDAGKALPLSDRIDFYVARDLRESWAKFQAGEIDIHPTIVPSAAETARVRQIEVGGTVQFLLFNFNDPLLGKNLALRKAIRAAVSTDRWAKGLGEGSLPAGASILGSASTAAIPTSELGIEVARNFLKTAGFPEGKGLPPLHLDLRSSDLQTLALGRSIAEDLEKVGIKLLLIQNPFQDYLQKLKRQEFQIAQAAWSPDVPREESTLELLYRPPFADPKKLRLWISPGLNTSSFNDYFYNAWFERLLPTPRGLDRDYVVKNLENIITAEVPVVLGAWPARRFSAQPWVLNFPQFSTGLARNRYKYVRVVQDMMPQSRR